LLSGPAGGVVGAFFLARRSGHSRVITFDMGGTSTDVALLDDSVPVTHESRVEGMPVGIPMMDIHTVGAGGGSIARLDEGGALRVGPESAGADPGPICYGRGSGLTVTDANVILGRLLGRFFLGGDMPLAPERIPRVLGKQSWTRQWKSLQHLAQGVIDVVNNNMEQAIRLISVERGYDVRDFTLVCFGGAGGLHAATLASGLGIPRVIVPPHPGALSALGLLLADARRNYSETLLGRGRPSLEDIRKSLARLHRIGLRDLNGEGFRRKDIVIHDAIDVRYVGQSYELTIPFSGRSWTDGFHKAHARRYGHSSPASPVEVVSVRTTLSGVTAKPALQPSRRKTPSPEPLEVGRVWLAGRWRRLGVYDRRHLGYGNVIRGPALIGEYTSTTFVPDGFRCAVDRFGNLVLSGVSA
jgi:N-methylhydantoinase A